MLAKEGAKFIETRKTPNGPTYRVYHFECSECQMDIKAQSNQLKQHSGKCRRCAQLGIPYEFIYQELKNHRNLRVEFTLSFSEFLDLIQVPVCHYCGTNLVYNKHSKLYGENFTRAHQLDRKDNLQGYTLKNVVPCCWECNRLKSDRFTYAEFLKLSPMLKEIMKERKI